MHGKLSLPRLSVRDYFTSILHEPQAHLGTLSPQGALLSADGRLPGPTSRSYVDKGKARAINAIDAIVDSVLYAKSALSSALAEASFSAPTAGPSNTASSSSTSKVTARPDKDVALFLGTTHRPVLSEVSTLRLASRRYSQVSAGSQSQSRRNRLWKHRGRRRTDADGGTPGNFPKLTMAVHMKGQSWFTNHLIGAKALPSRHLDRSLRDLADDLCHLSRRGDFDTALSKFSELYKQLDREGYIEPLKAAENGAFHINSVRSDIPTADRLLLLRHILTFMFFCLRSAYMCTTGSRWTQARDQRLQVQAHIEAVLLWVFKRPPLISLISFRNPRLAIASRLCMLSLPSIRETSERVVKSLTEEGRQDALPGVFQVLILALTHSDSAYLAFSLYKYACKRGVPVREVVARKLARVLSIEQRYAKATETFTLLEEQLAARQFEGTVAPTPVTSQTGTLESGTAPRKEPVFETQTLKARAAHRARCGQLDLVENDLALLKARPEARGWVTEARAHLRAEAAAANQDVEGCDAELAKRFALDWPYKKVPPGKVRPTTVVFSRRIQARLKAGQFREAEAVLERMVDMRQRPTSRAFADFLAACRHIDDVMLARRLLEIHQSLGHSLTTNILVSLMHIYARRQDEEGAERVLDLMHDLGMDIPHSAFTELLLAYVEAGEWEKAFMLFNRLNRSYATHHRPSPLAHSILLKGLVLSGSPLRQVTRFAESMKRQGLTFDAKTYALLLQSACDAGRMDVAADLFEAADGELMGGANAFHFSIIINGFLKTQEELRAKEYFEKMQSRGLQPSHVTYAMLVQQHARLGTDEGMQKAMKVAGWALSELEDLPRSSSISWANLSAMMYMPILRAEIDRGDSVAAEEIFGEMGAATGTTAIRCLTTLLDLLRQDGRTQAAMETWYQLVNLACADEYTTLLQVLENRVHSVLKADGTPRVAETRLRNSALLCQPLSIIMDTLSGAGLYDEAVQAWKLVRELKGAFDPDNWNVLMRVHAEAGRIRDALEIVEHVLRETPPDWAALRESATMGTFVPYPVERINLLEDAVGAKWVAQPRSRRDEHRVFENFRTEALQGADGEDGNQQGAARLRDSDFASDDGDGSDQQHPNDDLFEDETDETWQLFRADRMAGEMRDAASRKSADSTSSWIDEEDARDDRARSEPVLPLSRGSRRKARRIDVGDDPITVAMAQRVTIDSCFWFVHHKTLVALNDAVERQWRRGTLSGTNEVEADEDWEIRSGGVGFGWLGGATEGMDEHARPVGPVELQQRYPNAARVLGRFREQRQAMASTEMVEESHMQRRQASTG